MQTEYIDAVFIYEFMMRLYIKMFAHAVLLVKCQFVWILHVIYSETQ